MMICVGLDHKRILEQRYPLTIHRLVVIWLSKLAQAFTKSRPTTDHYLELQQVGAEVAHRRSRAWPAKKLKRDPASHAFSGVGGQWPHSGSYHPPGISREGLNHAESL